MAFIFVAGAALFLRSVFTVGYFKRFMRPGMAGETSFVHLGAGHMEDLAAALTMAVCAIGNQPMRGVAVGTVQVGMFARKILQILRRIGVTVEAHISRYIGKMKRAVRI